MIAEKTKKEGTKEIFIETVGRRKTSVARVRLIEASKNSVTVNNKDMSDYFSIEEFGKTVRDALVKSKSPQKFKVLVVVKGGGVSSQAEAIRHGIARALVIHTPDSRKKLKQAGFLKRDPRMKERRKFGLKKARKAPQWSKR